MTRLRWGGLEVMLERAVFGAREFEILEPALDAPPPIDLVHQARSLAADIPLHAHESILIVVPDRTRAFPLSTVLPALVGALVGRGASPERVRAIIASGTHVATGADVAPAQLGTLPKAVRVLRHDPDGPSVRCGVTPAGTPVDVAPALLEATRVLALGGTAFHYFAGFGGGGKMLFPGLGTRAAVAANHRLALGPLPPGGLAPGVEPGRTRGNPLAEDLRAVHAFLPEARHLTAWPTPGGWAGARWSSADEFDALCAHYAQGRRVGTRHRYDVVIASCGGSPRDLDVVQAHKALFHAALFARDGAELLLLAACDEGMGSPALERWLARSDRPALEADARAAYDLNAQTAISLTAIARRLRVTWATPRDLPALERWGVRIAADPVAACARACAAAGAGARIALVPAACDVLPRLAARLVGT